MTGTFRSDVNALGRSVATETTTGHRARCVERLGEYGSCCGARLVSRVDELPKGWTIALRHQFRPVLADEGCDREALRIEADLSSVPLEPEILRSCGPRWEPIVFYIERMPK
jgi:hypothetical protein